VTGIHPTAIIYPGVMIDLEGVYIGPYCVIGGPPEHREFYDGKESKGVIIKKGAKIFSHVSIDSGTLGPTIIEEGVQVFNHAHVAHDCILERRCCVGGSVSLAGHTIVMEGANVSGKSCTFQRVVIGAYSFVGGGSFVVRDIPPGEKWLGYNPRKAGLNEVGLSRSGLTYEECLTRHKKRFEELINDKTRV
jgi:acyl-[acyl carrier protein]--UDP-N-acetylglucosamine O-acyltransferase